MTVTNYKSLHFGDWLIKVTCYFGCLYSVIAYNASTDSTLIVDALFVLEGDAFGYMTDKLRTLTPVVSK